MQLVDAIRQAAKRTTPVAADAEPAIAPSSTAAAGTQPLHVPAPAVPHRDVFGGSVVRLELFLSPDQLNNLLRGIIGTQHSVLTMREAAKYVRLTAADLEQLCTTHQIPAFKLEGKWRFPKLALDEWLAAQRIDIDDTEEAADGD